MLVLSHKLHERTFVYDTESDSVVVVSLADIDRNKVRIGFHGGQQVRFWRESILSPQQVRELDAKLARQMEGKANV